jgi:tryptophanyl-tRNA synthetase
VLNLLSNSVKFTPAGGQIIVFSGMQPSGDLHLGNYLGAMVNWVEMQETHETASTASSTCTRSPSGRTRRRCRKAIREVTAAYIAAGIDPKRSIIFNQSQVPSTPSSPGCSTASPASAG